MQDARDLTIHPFQRLAPPLTPIPTGTEPRLRRINGIQAVVFDVYGTLVISGSGDVGSADENHHERALKEALAASCLSPPDDVSGAAKAIQQIIREHHAVSGERGIANPEVNILAVWRQWITQFYGADSASVPQVHQLALEFEARANPAVSMPAARQVIEMVRERGLKLGIVSNAQFFTLDLLKIVLGRSLAECGFDLDLCLFSYRFGHAKPGLGLFQRLADTLKSQGIAPGEALYIGNDLRNDVWAAAQLGMRTGLFAGDLRSLRLREDDSRLVGCDADIVITSLSQLDQIL